MTQSVSGTKVIQIADKRTGELRTLVYKQILKQKSSQVYKLTVSKERNLSEG